MTNLARNQQRAIEEKYSRHMIRNIIVSALKDMDFEAINIKAKKAIFHYIKGDYYESKTIRMRHLAMNISSVQDIIDEIMIIVIPQTGQQPIQAASARLAHLLKFNDAYDGIKTAAELLTVVCDTDMYDIVLAKDSITGSIMIESNYTLSEEVLQQIEDKKYLPPMICVPQIIHNNSDSGYITKNESVILGSDNHHEEYQALDVINTAGQVALSLDRRIVEFEEVSKKPLDTPEKIRNFLRMIISSRKIYRDLIKQGNLFYLNWRYDKRGRIYSQGYQVNIQSTAYKKALINLHKKEIIDG